MTNYIIKVMTANRDIIVTNSSTVAVVPRVGDKIKYCNMKLNVLEVVWDYENGNITIIEVIVGR